MNKQVKPKTLKKSRVSKKIKTNGIPVPANIPLSTITEHPIVIQKKKSRKECIKELKDMELFQEDILLKLADMIQDNQDTVINKFLDFVKQHPERFPKKPKKNN